MQTAKWEPSRHFWYWLTLDKWLEVETHALSGLINDTPGLCISRLTYAIHHLLNQTQQFQAIDKRVPGWSTQWSTLAPQLSNWQWDGVLQHLQFDPQQSNTFLNLPTSSKFGNKIFSKTHKQCNQSQTHKHEPVQIIPCQWTFSKQQQKHIHTKCNILQRLTHLIRQQAQTNTPLLPIQITNLDI